MRYSSGATDVGKSKAQFRLVGNSAAKAAPACCYTARRLRPLPREIQLAIWADVQKTYLTG
jgi:hypothetical protein